ncbi:SDR family oxidoreductase [Pseudenhygromyxa sp. WMMC2535]|uniref:SDR family oxidoreductase n=1 Tax=Pseudenhygromyxa sp. WMMC2535 TaxID=2712867 RepID=UPI00155387F3|nr:SDR family oxidoreductase [Pseudenhygromyxa sp. WMMC2535]
MQIDLSGKRALVTGSTQGIGFGVAQGLAAAGAQVTVNGRRRESVDAAIAEIKAAVPGAKLDAAAIDLGDAAGCAALVAAHPDYDIVVNNLGIFGPHDFYDIPDEEWTRFFEVNVMSGVRLARAYTKAMAERGWGRVVFLSSESAFNIPADMIHYGFTKTAVVSIARGLAKRLAGTGVTVNSVLPGPTLTKGVEDMLAEQVAATGKRVEEVAVDFVVNERPSSILRRPATVEEVANMVVYTCSTQASATTGAALRVDGGVLDSL